MEGREGPAAALTAAGGAAEATGGDPAGAADLALLAAAFLAAFSAFLAAFLLGPSDDAGTASCKRQKKRRAGHKSTHVCERFSIFKFRLLQKPLTEG